MDTEPENEIEYRQIKNNDIYFAHSYQFTTRVSMDGVNLDVVNETKLLGTHITSDINWDLKMYRVCYVFQLLKIEENYYLQNSHLRV